MTRQEIITHLAGVVAAVFRAEDKLRPEWQQRLQTAKTADEETKEAICGDYLQAIAEEMLSAIPEEELQKLYNSEQR